MFLLFRSLSLKKASSKILMPDHEPLGWSEVERSSPQISTQFLIPEQKNPAKEKAQNQKNRKKISWKIRLIEGSVSVAIIGILGAIALPGFLAVGGSCGGGARQSEAKQYVGSMNRAQQAFYLENGAFSTNISNLDLGISEETLNYSYFMRQGDGYVLHYGVPRNAEVKEIKAIIGLVALTTDDQNQTTTIAELCIAQEPGQIPEAPTLKQGEIICSEGSVSAY